MLCDRSARVHLIHGRIDKGWDAAFREAVFARINVQIVNPCSVTCLEKTCMPTLWARNCKTRKPLNSPHSNFSPGISDEEDKSISRCKNREDFQLSHFFLKRWFKNANTMKQMRRVADYIISDNT